MSTTSVQFSAITKEYLDGQRTLEEMYPTLTSSPLAFARFVRKYPYFAFTPKLHQLYVHAIQLTPACPDSSLTSKTLSTLITIGNEDSIHAFLSRCEKSDMPLVLKIKTCWDRLPEVYRRIQEKFCNIQSLYITARRTDSLLQAELTALPQTLKVFVVDQMDYFHEFSAFALNQLLKCCPDLKICQLPYGHCRKLTTEEIETAPWPASLQVLSMDGKAFTNATVKRLLQRCPELRTLELPGCEQITAIEATSTKIQILNLDDSHINEASFRALARQCPELRHLSLRGCYFYPIQNLAQVSFESHFERLDLNYDLTLEFDESKCQKSWSNGMVLHFMAKSLLKKGMPDQLVIARRLLEQAVVLMPRYYGALFDLATLLTTSYGDHRATPAEYGRARVIFETLLLLWPSDVEVQRSLALLYLDVPEVKNLERAKQLLEKLISVHHLNTNYLQRRYDTLLQSLTQNK